jgi:hypothetical protein
VAALLLVVVGAFLLNSGLKELFQRARPTPVASLAPAQAWSFPSGHATVSAAFYSFLAYLSWRLLRGVRRLLWTAALLALVLLIGLSRLYLGVHFLTDVIAGYLAGFVWTDAVILGGRVLGRPPGAPMTAALRGSQPLTRDPAAGGAGRGTPPALPLARGRAQMSPDSASPASRRGKRPRAAKRHPHPPRA